MKRAGIWLLLGLPVTLAEYENRMLAADTPGCSDYLARFDDTRLPPEQRCIYRADCWRRDYAAVISEPWQELCDRAKTLGCEVRPAATLADLQAAAGQARVIIIFTHWKGASFAADDFLRRVEPDDDIAFLVDREAPSRLAEIDHPLAAWLRAAMTGRPGRWFGLGRTPPMTAREALRRCIDACIDVRPPPGIHSVQELPTTRASRRREQLDQWFAGCVRPGNRLELFDGLWDARSLGQALNGFDGVLDLSACTTTFLGDRLGAAAGHSFRTVQFLQPQDPVEAAWRLGIALEAAGGDPEEFPIARRWSAELLPGAVAAELCRRKG